MPGNPPKVSVILSVRNGSDTLDRCLGSVANQIFRDFELICINDGSSDGTTRIIDLWKKRFKSGYIKVINHQVSIGLTKSLNEGIKLARGDYIARIDADDWWTPQKIDLQVKYLDNHKDCGLVGSNYVNVSSDGYKEIRLPQSDSDIRKKIFLQNPFGHSCVVISRRLLTGVGGYDEKFVFVQDYDLWFRLLPRTKFHNLSQILCLRQVSGNVKKQQAKTKYFLVTWFKHYRKYKPGLYNLRGIFQPLIILFLPNWTRYVGKVIHRISRKTKYVPQRYSQTNVENISGHSVISHSGGRESLRIVMPIKTRMTGGTPNFAKKFQLAAAKLGHQVDFDFFGDYDVLLVIARCNLKYLHDARNRGKKIIHRLDGVYYPSTYAGWLYPLYNYKLELIHRKYADAIIYQSKFSAKVCHRFLGSAGTANLSIIYNGVDLNLFKPTPELSNHRAKNPIDTFMTWSQFRAKNQIEPLIDAMDLYNTKQKRPAKLNIIGDFIEEVENFPFKYKDRKDLVFMGPKENSMIPSLAKEASIFLISTPNSACPNNVIEAMACGLPICGIADGAMAEIVVHGLNARLTKPQNEGFYRARNFDLNDFTQNMRHLMLNLDSYSQASRMIATSRFNIDIMFDKYLKVINETMIN